MDALGALGGTRTIIMIAHRLTSLRRADTVHVLESGRIVASGPPAQVIPAIDRHAADGTVEVPAP